MSLAAFCSDVMRPALNAIAPPAERLMKRYRNGALIAAGLAMLLPRFAPLGTGTTDRVWAVAGAYGVCGALAIVLSRRASGPYVSAGAFAVAGGVVYWAGHGATWGLSLAALAVISAVLTEVRRRAAPLPPAPVDPDPLPAAQRGAPAFVAGIAHSIITVLIAYSFVVEPTHIPTGSMQPTLMGNRPHAGGDRVLADRAAFTWRDPRRWEVAVFRYPLRRDILFVKRIVGLPGETVEIRDGDIWVNGEIARKPRIVQETLWREVFPRPNPLARRKSVAGNWKVSEDQGWRRDGDDGLRLSSAGERSVTARFGRRLTVPDVRVGFTALDVGAGDRVAARVASRGATVTLEVVAGSGGTLTLEGDAPISFEADLSERARVELEVVDGLARAVVDAVDVARVEVPVDGAGRNFVEIGGAGELRFLDLRVDEDIAYRQGPGPHEFEVPDDGYVVLGDNTTNSMDSRAWQALAFHVRGRDEPLWAEPSSPLAEGGRESNVKRADGFVAFVDADGIRRRIPREDIEKEVPLTARPYVRRKDMLGRGALVYWPWVAAEAGFRPRLIP